MDFVVAHLEGGDAGALALTAFQIDEELAGVLPDCTQFVQFAVVAAGNDAAVAYQNWRFLDNGALQQFENSGIFVYAPEKFGEER